MNLNGQTYSGVDFERRVFLLCRLGSKMSGDTLVRDGSISATWQVEEALNAALLEVWQRLGEINPERITRHWDCTYPADADFVALRAGAQAGTPYPDPAFPQDWLDLVRIHDRDDPNDDGEIYRTTHDQFAKMVGLRWMYDSDMLWLSDVPAGIGTYTSYDLRVWYIPSLPKIDIGNSSPRIDIPLELHRAIAEGAAARVGMEHGLTHRGELQSRYEADVDLALRSLRSGVQGAEYVTYTRE